MEIADPSAEAIDQSMSQVLHTSSPFPVSSGCHSRGKRNRQIVSTTPHTPPGASKTKTYVAVIEVSLAVLFGHFPTLAPATLIVRSPLPSGQVIGQCCFSVPRMVGLAAQASWISGKRKSLAVGSRNVRKCSMALGTRRSCVPFLHRYTWQLICCLDPEICNGIDISMSDPSQINNPCSIQVSTPLAKATPGPSGADDRPSTAASPSRSVKVARQILVLARVLISITGIIYLFSFWRMLDFTWYGRSQLQGSILCWSAMFCLALRAVGSGGWLLDRTLSMSHFLGAQCLLMQSRPYPTVNEGLYTMLAFWCCFIRLNPPRGAEISTWAPTLLGVNVAVSLHTSGIDKWADPLWQQGYGFYDFLRLNWVRARSADWMLELTSVLVFMNYAALFTEVGALPLMLFRWTRPLACLAILGFFASLIWPFRMDMIGETGICIAMVVLAGAIAALGKKQRLPPLGWVMVVYMLIVGGADLTGVWAGVSRGNLRKTLEAAHEVLNALDLPILQELNARTTIMTPNSLFAAQHLLNTWAWRVIVKMPDGSTSEPIRVFNRDRSGGPDTQAFGCTRHYQACIYAISAMARRQNVRNVDRWPVEALMAHAVRKAGGVSAQLIGSPLDEPFSGRWLVICEYSPKLQPTDGK
jgi:hypothetical protein